MTTTHAQVPARPLSSDAARLAAQLAAPTGPDPAQLLAALNRWIDSAPANADRPREVVSVERIAKLQEEVGELARELMPFQLQISASSGQAMEALLAFTGGNPRKGRTGDLLAVRHELLDVALTALCAVEHLDGGGGTAWDALVGHMAAVAARAGIITP
jgi:NTP pyrophosphatase (non-canonical NTP hydrolase)